MPSFLKNFSLILLLGLVVTGCEQKQEPIRLGTNIWPDYEPLYLAQRIDLLDAERVRLIGYPSASEVILAFRNRSLEAASLTMDEALLLLDKEVPIKIILVHDISDGADVIVARAEIEDISDLRNRNVGVESTALGAYVISRALAMHDLDLSEIQIKHLDVNQHEAAFRDGDIDAAVTFEPFRTRLLEMGAREIFSSREVPGEIVDVLVVHEHVYETRLGELRHITQSWFGALAYLENQPHEAAAAMAKRLKIQDDEVLESLRVIRFPTREQNIALLSKSNGQLLPMIRKLNGFMNEAGLISKDEPIQSLLTPDAL